MDLKTKKLLWILIASFILILLVGAAVTAHIDWMDDQLKYQDVTI